METLVVVVFIIGYLAITLEHNLRVDKIIPALSMMAVTWAIISMGHLQVFEVNMTLKVLEPSHVKEMLLHHLGKTSEILMFLIGAMTIVEIIEYFDGFLTIKSFIKTKNKIKLLWIFTTLAFILSAIIDNLTATIVLIAILQKLISDKKIKFWYAGLIIIAANAGGAWSPIGDVTTTMLWIAGKVTPLSLIDHTLLASIVCFVVPTFIASRFSVFKGALKKLSPEEDTPKKPYMKSVLIIGLLGIVFVPIFKTVTGLPPYIGMGFSLAFVCLYAEIISNRHFKITKVMGGGEKVSPIHHSLSKIEFSSILFFFGILMTVAAVESLGQLFHFAEVLNDIIPNKSLVIMIMGVASAIIDNVPLVAAGIGMFSEPMDHPLWHELAFSAGTGGSMLIIGSAAGVIAMGMEKIEFFEYFKKISWLALIGFLLGYATMILTA